MTSGESAHDNTPAMDLNDTSTSEKIDGIVVQTHADHAADGQDRIIAVLKQRFDQAGIEVSDDEIVRLAKG